MKFLETVLVGLRVMLLCGGKQVKFILKREDNSGTDEMGIESAREDLRIENY